MRDSATVAHDFKLAFHQAVKDLMAADPDTEHVLVSFGTPGTFEPEDIIMFGRVSETQDAATLGTNRSREETVSLEVTVSSFRGGGEEQEQVAHERAYQLLRLIERYVRVDDVTVGGTVRQCFLVSHESDGVTEVEMISEGRTIDVVATFQAKARISN